MQAELDAHGLCVQEFQGRGRGLVTNRSIREGDIICPCSCIYFTDESKLLQCLQANDYFVDSETWLCVDWIS